MKISPTVILGLAAMLTGVSIVVWSLLRRHRRDRPRCPRCWYDMRATEGLTCAECGSTADRPQHLLKVRRRWASVATGLVLLIGGASLLLQPKVARDGWWSLVPTTVLLKVAPMEPGITYLYVAGSGPPASSDMELVRRDVSDRLWGWQWRLLMDRDGFVRTRHRWPVGVPMAAEIRIPSWLWVDGISIEPEMPGGCASKFEKLVYGCLETMTCHETIDHGREFLGTPRQVGDVPIVAQVNVRRLGAPGIPAIDQILWRGRLKRRIEVVPRVDDVLEKLGGDEVTAAMANGLAVFARACHSPFCRCDRVAIEIRLDRSVDPILERIGFGFRVSAVRNGEILGDIPVTARGTAILEEELGRELLNPATRHEWRIMVRGDGVKALYDWDRDAYWSGELCYPLSDMLVTRWPERDEERMDQREQPGIQ